MVTTAVAFPPGAICRVPGTVIVNGATGTRTVTLIGAVTLPAGLPPVPTTRTFAVLNVAPAVATNTTFPVVAPLAIVTGATVNPALKPAVVTVTGPVNPALRTMVTTAVAFPPGAISRAPGTVIVNGATGTRTVTVTGAVTLPAGLPPVPTTRTFAVPKVAVAAAANVTVPVVAPLAIVTGATVNPALKPSTTTVTGPVNPLVRAIVTVSALLVPCTTSIAPGVAANVNGAVTVAACTTSVNEVVARKLPIANVAVNA